MAQSIRVDLRMAKGVLMASVMARSITMLRITSLVGMRIAIRLLQRFLLKNFCLRLKLWMEILFWLFVLCFLLLLLVLLLGCFKTTSLEWVWIWLYKLLLRLSVGHPDHHLLAAPLSAPTATLRLRLSVPPVLG